MRDHHKAGSLFSALGSLALAGLLVLAACRSAPKPSPTPTPAPTATPTPWPTPTPTRAVQSAKDIATAARQGMLGLGSFHFQLSQTGGGTPLIAGVEVVGAEGDVVTPNQVQASLSATVMGVPTMVKVVALGGSIYVTNPLTGQWQLWTDRSNLLGTFDPSRALDGLLAQTIGLTVLGAANLDGVATFRVGGTVDASVLATLVGGGSAGTRVQVELWVGQADSLLYQVQIRGRVTATEKEGIVRLLRLSRFNEPVRIQPPL